MIKKCCEISIIKYTKNFIVSNFIRFLNFITYVDNYVDHIDPIEI
jgi:hypothetical protein